VNGIVRGSTITDLLVGLSVSDSPNLPTLGLRAEHLEHAYVELARQLLAAGASLAYGGDLRAGGFTERLVDLLNTYARDDRPGRERIRDYLAWPLHGGGMSEADLEKLAALTMVATVVRVPRPPAPDPSLPSDLRDRVEKSESYTAMRTQMTHDIDVRIILGGRLTGFMGRFPGLAEEALLAAVAAKPLYLLGGFGGCARALAELVDGRVPDELRVDQLRADDPTYDRLLAALPEPPDDAVTAPLAGRGPGCLHNGLDDEENRRLFESSDIDEVIALVLRGLRILQPR
jgi:hypothetical protein